MFELRRWAAAGVVTLLAGVLAPAGSGTAEAETRPEPSHEIEVTHLTLPDRDRVSDEMLMNERGEVVLHSNGVFHWHDGKVTRINPEGTPATATAISAKGQVVGDAGRQPFSWVKGEWEILPLGNTSSAYPVDVNDRGTIAGFANGPAVGEQAFVAWKDGELIRAPEEVEVEPFFSVVLINNRNEVAISGLKGAVIWDVDTGEVTDLGTLGGDLTVIRAINDRGMATGFSETADEDDRAFLWHDGEMTDLGTLGGSSSEGADINKRGQIVGESFTAEGVHAFMWEDGEMTDLGTLGGAHSFALGINKRGDVVGYSVTSDYYNHATLWRDGEVVDLGEAADPDVWSSALDINDRGHIVGYTEGDGWLVYHGVMWTVKERHDHGR